MISIWRDNSQIPMIPMPMRWHGDL